MKKPYLTIDQQLNSLSPSANIIGILVTNEYDMHKLFYRLVFEKYKYVDSPISMDDAKSYHHYPEHAMLMFSRNSPREKYALIHVGQDKLFMDYMHKGGYPHHIIHATFLL